MESQIAEISHNLKKVEERIAKAAYASGRDADSVTLVTVSKLQPLTKIAAAIAVGITNFGENYPEEAAPKISHFADHPLLRWHMIGHIQSRKLSLVVKNFQMLHSLDNVSHAEKLSRLLVEEGKTMDTLLEMNVSGEGSKSGFPAWNEADWPALIPEVEKILSLKNLNIAGLMTMPPLFADVALTRPYFIRLRRLRDFLADHFEQTQWHHLSMGTSADYETAILEGATIVRIGQAILGAR